MKDLHLMSMNELLEEKEKQEKILEDIDKEILNRNNIEV